MERKAPRNPLRPPAKLALAPRPVEELKPGPAKKTTAKKTTKKATKKAAEE
jgi:hypothetical protein